jgi:hypothetical protein
LRWQELPQFSADAGDNPAERVPRLDHHGFARTALARNLFTALARNLFKD